MENKKNIFIGIGIVIVIIAIILVIALTGKKKADTTPVAATTDTPQTQDTLSHKTSKPSTTSTFAVAFPKNGSTLMRGQAYTVSWVGPANCYDLGYVLNPKVDTPYIFIAKVCKNDAAAFSYKWIVPPNLQPGTYGLQLKDSGVVADQVRDITTFTIK
jgi:hypothetical protein